MNPKYKSMIHKQLTTYFKVNCGYILDIINHMGSVLGSFRGSVIGKSYGLL